jgi:zinc D-Ala-D-Ala dipeptidase
MRMARWMAILFVLLFASPTLTLAQKSPPRKHPLPHPRSYSNAALPEIYAPLLKDTSQAIVVITADWNAVDGSLQRYEKREGNWVTVGDKIPVVVGKNGLAWDELAEPSVPGAPVKKEGDGRSPAGIFTIGQAFGFAPSAPELKLPYLPLNTSTECVDDSNSNDYNQIVDREQILYPNWNSSEKMRTIDAYKQGAVIDYNADHFPDAGSCIFLHIWSGPGHGTAGCTAMPEANLTQVLYWLDESKKPVLIQLPAAMYKDVSKAWDLP